MSIETIAGGRYRVERVLGDGGMASVLLAEDEELGRLVAVKLLDERFAADANFRSRFAREARAAASLSHPNVVGVYDVGEADGRPFIVMEHVEGRTLEQRLREEGALAPDEVCRVGRQVCAGLGHAHAAGLVHRDLKPGNLIERSDGTIKIADFGVARLIEGTELTEAGTIIGTAAYLAPEQAEGGEVTQPADVFALGVVLYELLTGRRPWQIDSLEQLAARASAPPPEPPDGTPSPLREAIVRSLRPDPRERPTVSELADLLDVPDEGATLVIPRARRTERRARRRVPGAVVAIVLVGAALVLGALAASLATGGDEDGASGGGTVAEVQPLEDGATSSEDARNLADWLRENASS